MKLLLNIDVHHLSHAEAFYTAAFGLHVHRRFGEEVTELLGGDVPIYLLRKAAGSAGAADQKRDYARHWTPMHCDVVVDHLESALARALTAGAVQEGAIRSASWGRIVQLADPFGHGWCLLQFVGRGYDEIVWTP
jgi:predicted enzyme related to lactoylglutathione lyase